MVGILIPPYYDLRLKERLPMFFGGFSFWQWYSSWQIIFLLVSAKSWKRLNYASVLPINRHYRCIFQKVSPSHTFIPFFLADSRFLWQNKAILLSYSSSWPAVKSFKTHALGHFSSIYWLVLADSRWKIQNEESLGGLLLRNGIHKHIKPAFESHFFVTKKF